MTPGQSLGDIEALPPARRRAAKVPEPLEAPENLRPDHPPMAGGQRSDHGLNGYTASRAATSNG